MVLNLLIYMNKRKLNKMITSGYSYDEILKQSQKLDKLINIYMRNWVRWKKISLAKYKKICNNINHKTSKLYSKN